MTAPVQHTITTHVDGVRAYALCSCGWRSPDAVSEPVARDYAVATHLPKWGAVINQQVPLGRERIDVDGLEQAIRGSVS